jgi:hypothetical protein
MEKEGKHALEMDQEEKEETKAQDEEACRRAVKARRRPQKSASTRPEAVEAAATFSFFHPPSRRASCAPADNGANAPRLESQG